MSRSNKPDIADFFRPYGKTIPRKRPTPDLDGADQTTVSPLNTTRTPTSTRTTSVDSFEHFKGTPKTFNVKPLATPRTGRSIDIPIRSPTSETPTSVRRSLIGAPQNRPTQPSDKPASSLSFADLTTSNRGVVEDGKLVVVRDSDDSDDSLESLSELVSRKNKSKVVHSSSHSNEDTHEEDERRRVLSLFTGGRSEPILRKDKIRELQKLEQANKIDLNFIFEEDHKERKMQERLAKANTNLEISTREMEEQKQIDMDKKLLAAILQGDEDDMDPEELARLVSAVERTKALTGEKQFCFFGKRGPSDLSKRNISKAKFPVSAIPASLWPPKDVAARDRAYLSGFVTELSRSGKLADDVVRWTFDAALSEQRDDLVTSYIGCVTASSSRWTRANITPSDIQSIFEMLGADPEVLRDGVEIESSLQLKRDVQARDFRHLHRAVKLLSSICQDMDYPTLSKLTSIMFRLPLDQQVMADNQAGLAIQEFLAKLINLPNLDSQHHIHERLLLDLGTNLKEPTLQARLFPYLYPSSQTTAFVRIRLASHFLLGADLAKQYLKPQSTSSSLRILMQYLAISPIFTTTKSKSSLSSSTDYMTLTALTIVLDVAIAHCHPPRVFADRNEEDTFNADVDDVAGHIHALFVSIADSGASHLRRTEAKDILQELYVKLLHTLRTRPRKKRHVFDMYGNFVGGSQNQVQIRDVLDVEQEVRGREFMAKFLKKEKYTKETGGIERDVQSPSGQPN